LAIDKVEISTQTEDVELNEDIQDEQTIKGTQIEEHQAYSIAQSYCIYFCAIKDKKSLLLNNDVLSKISNKKKNCFKYEYIYS
jgi:hypothetical protein